jgi:hypothetical protein
MEVNTADLSDCRTLNNTYELIEVSNENSSGCPPSKPS